MLDTALTARDRYFHSLPHTPLLTTAEEAALAAQIHDTQLPQADRMAARDTLILANLRLVVQLAATCRDSPFDLDDRIQEGTLGLARAARDFDPAKGRFSTYATPWVHKYIQRATENTGRAIRVPVHTYTQRRALERATQQFIRAHGRPPRIDEQAAAIGATVAQVAHVLQTMQPIASLHQPVGSNGDDPTPLGDRIAAPGTDWDTALIVAEQRQALHAALGQLTERQRTVLRLRYRLDEPSGAVCRTLAEVGQLLGGVSREYVRQVEAKALTLLRAQLADPDA